MQFKDFIIGIALFSMIVVGVIVATVNVADNYANMGYNVSLDDNQSLLFDKAGEMNSKAEAMQQTITGTDAGGQSSLYAFFVGGVWGTIQIGFSALAVAGALIEQIGIILHMPAMVVGFITFAIIVTVIYAGIMIITNQSGSQ
jgi:hypothetical protein